MSRKLSISVLLHVLVFAAASVSWSASNQFKDGIFPLVRNAPPAGLQADTLEPSPIVNAQAGTPLALPGTFCVGDWMGPRKWSFSSTFGGGETYYSLQDPSGSIPHSWGALCSPPYTFSVTAINFEIKKRPSSQTINPYTFSLQPVVFDADLTNPGCPIPAGVKCAGPIYMVTLDGGTTGTTFKINLPFSVECCVNGPYFGAVYLAGSWAVNIAMVTTDGAGSTPPPPPPQPCHNYLRSGTDLYDWITDLTGAYHLRLYSEGYTPNDPVTPCTPGVCGWQWWYGVGRDVANPVNDPDLFLFTIPNTSGTRQKISVRFPSGGLDTLKQIAFMGMTYAGAPDILVEIFGEAYGPSCGLVTKPGSLLYSVTIPNASLVNPPLTNNVSIPDIVWGVLNGGQSKDLFVSISVPGGLPNQYALYTRKRSYASCTSDPHTMFNVSGSWIYGGDYTGDDDEAYIDAFACREYAPPHPPPCAQAGPDDWNTWMHDYGRSGASRMSVGDPCAVRGQWSKYLPDLSSFTSPIIAGGKVYVASDGEVSSFDLATGAPGNAVGVYPYTQGSVRCNVSAEGNRVFITGGTAMSISCWDTTLTTLHWSNDATGAGLTNSSNGVLLTRNRFGATVICTVGPDSLVIVGTEMMSSNGHGWLYALDAKTGFLYHGWSTNPIALDRGSWLSPSFDGTNLYVGTADYPYTGDGSLYSINAATGAVNWNYKDAAAPLEGWPGGVSIDGNFLYGATYYNDPGVGQSSGHRYAIDVSLAGPGPTLNPAAIRWRRAEGPTLYASPTVSWRFLYIPQDVPSYGILMVDKYTGQAVYNFFTVGVGSVPLPVTLTCDRYLFAGDRQGFWHMLNTLDQSLEWRRQFGGIVNGTAIAHHFITGDDYAVVNARSSAGDPNGFGVVTAWRFHQQARPFLHQYVYSTEILVPLNSTAGLSHIEAGVFGNDACVSLNFGTPIIHDPSPAAGTYTDIQKQYAAAYVNRKLGSDYVTYFEGGRPSKKDRLAGAGMWVDQELTVLDKALEDANRQSFKNRSGADLAAGATDVVRTSNVSYTMNPLPPGQTTHVIWTYDGTGLGRGIDEEYIEAVNNDPDFNPEDLTYSNGYPALHIRYLGGCQEQNTTITWNTLGAPNTERMWNYGALGNESEGALIWGADPESTRNLYDGSFLLLGDSSAAIGGAQVRIDLNGWYYNLYRPNARPSDNTCGFDAATDIHLGYRREGGCPGQRSEIRGAWVRTSYIDTNSAYPPGSPLSSIGVNVTQTEVGAHDPIYGDFKLIQWKLGNRDAVAKELKAGSYIDWDIIDFSANASLLSDNFNGYLQWDSVTPRFAYGMFDPNLPAAYCGIDPTANSPHKIASIARCWSWYEQPPFCPARAECLWHLSERPPYRQYDPVCGSYPWFDRSGLLVNKGFTLPANGNYDVVQAMFATPIPSNNIATIDALGVGVAKRAARWAGFARGDVNDDGCVNLADVCWLLSGNQLYPDTYCGDVNLDGTVNSADQQYLLRYISGIGSAPRGAWRFTF